MAYVCMSHAWVGTQHSWLDAVEVEYTMKLPLQQWQSSLFYDSANSLLLFICVLLRGLH